MLSGVLLHVVEAARPVNTAVYVGTFRTAVGNMNNFVAFLAHVEDVCVAELARIMRLPAGRGIKGRAVQDHAPDRRCDP